MRKSLERMLFIFLVILAFCLAGSLIWGLVVAFLWSIDLYGEGRGYFALIAVFTIILLAIALGITAWALIDLVRWRQRHGRQNKG
jgi:hypothetical protein